MEHDTWPHMVKGDNDHLYFGDGTKRAVSTTDLTLPYGKYAGRTVAEIDDVGYLRWLHETAVEKPDWFLERVVTMRLKELT